MQKTSLLAIGLIAGLGAAAQARPLTINDVVSLSRIGGADVSPDGRWLVWDQRETDMAANKGRTDLWRLDLSRKGAVPEKLAADPAKSESGPAFSPDGQWVFFTADNGGKSAVWRVAIAGGAPELVADQDVSGFRIAPTGDKLLVWADRPVGAKSLADKAASKDGGSARTYDHYFVRHWDTWSDGQRSQLFVLPLAGGKATGDGVAIGGALVGDTPSKPFGDGSEIAWSKDGRTVYFTLREAGTTEPLSTNLDIFAAPADGSAAPVNLTEANQATDTLPTVSPDGKWLAYVAMKRPTYEADRQVIQLRNLATGEVRALTEGWDRSVGSLAWSRDGKTLYATAQDTGDDAVFAVDLATGKPARLTGEGTAAGVLATPRGYVYTLNSLTAPSDFYAGTGVKAGGKPTRLTWVNKDKLAGIDMPGVEHVGFKGANGDTVWAYVMKPAGLAEGAKAPMAFLVHGGPQSSFGNGWSYRWNPALFAGAGYGAVMVDFHGSTGYGQAFTDAINKDWGGKPLEDLKLGFAAVTAKYGWLDGSRACAAGGSYGGYMMNWIAGNWPDGFKCLVTHAGVFDARAMAYETEELWFDEWEHGGPYFEVPANYEKWNPVNHVAAWKTPMLVIHGEKDFRIPYTQGIAAFTAAQRRGIESRLVVYPDENHWILKPKNSIQWYTEVLGWMDEHTKGK
ncbi:peptidase S9, prolyl oligopeptidase active site domain protein [Rhizorhabdus wittichii RW1]|uniref:Peptidase S9, prolyl oligopeptidase active site domain protein n=1 Tax=Rhizorhabdus wittichii (strain DSM 6014 / CCUG 31198 / JCM 15750 / NBRC 105917 / EY 4224 / RW1) TaxID=392499 RepID=A0A9J9LD49_RHIWR|nr:peptidase S9, prolyl oligopeptidase active site domain protein [Rhizorhabdus wittichii RW1]